MTGSWTHFLAQAAILVPVFLISVSFHEFCHAVVAFFLGDPTAKRAGRMTLNPLAHIDPLGVLFLIIFRIGWATPVPMNQNNFKYPRIYSVIAALAGPLSNLFLAITAFLTIKFFPVTLFSTAITATALQFFQALASVNIMLGVFNLFPIPPLDGSKVLFSILGGRLAGFQFLLERYGFFIIIGMIFLAPQIVGSPICAAFNLLIPGACMH